MLPQLRVAIESDGGYHAGKEDNANPRIAHDSPCQAVLRRL